MTGKTVTVTDFLPFDGKQGFVAIAKYASFISDALVNETM
jgi:hypothetical protein